MELIKNLLREYKELIKTCELARNLDEDVFHCIERAAIEIASALTILRTRGKIDPKYEKEIDEILSKI